MWSAQREIAFSLVNNRRTTVQAGHGVGKSWLAARLAAFWLSVHPLGEAFVVTTAPTDDQVKAVLWRELGMVHEKGGLPGKTTLDAKWHMGAMNQQLVAYGRKPADYRPTSMQGIHAKHVLAILDEAAGIPYTIWDAVASLTSTKGSAQLAIGNPTDPSSHFARVCAPGSGWNRFKISVFDTPVYTGEDVHEALLDSLTSAEWVDERKIEYGTTAPLDVARVLGEFPDLSDDTLIHPKWIREAQERSLKRTRKPHLGIDVARFGQDETVIMQRQGGWARVAWAGHKRSTMETTGHIVRVKKQLNAEPGLNDFVTMAVDADGLGACVYDRLRELGHDVGEIRGGRPAMKPGDFVNARSEWFWNLRERFEAGEIDIDPTDDKLAAQLGAIKWTMVSKGQIQVETKDQMRARGLPSPDRADALAYAFAHVDLLPVDV
jgi:hypothetical protein